MTTINISKRALRKHMSQVLQAIPSESITVQSQHAVNALLRMAEYKAASRISVYLCMAKGEVQTQDVVADALSSGKRVFVPYTYSANIALADEQVSIMDMLALHSLEDYHSFQLDKWGIPTPPAGNVSSRQNCLGGFGPSNGQVVEKTEVEAGLDLVIMPGMAFDIRLGRLGHGKGYYDNFLSRCSQAHHAGLGNGMPFLVGLALNEQVLPEHETVPTSPRDWRLDALVTGNGNVITP